jgi:hypothetical protein
VCRLSLFETSLHVYPLVGNTCPVAATRYDISHPRAVERFVAPVGTATCGTLEAHEEQGRMRE